MQESNTTATRSVGARVEKADTKKSLEGQDMLWQNRMRWCTCICHLHLVHPGGMQEVGIHGGCGLRVEPLDLSGQQIPRRLTRGTTYSTECLESRVPRVRRDEEEGQEGQVGQQTETPPCWTCSRLGSLSTVSCATPRRCRSAKPSGTPALDLTARYLIQRYIGGMLAFAGVCLQDHPYPPDRTHFMISCFHPRAVPSSHRCLRKDRRTIHLTATATLRE
jgi:hypothetical protein